MTLDLTKVANQIDDMGRILAERRERQRRTLPAALQLLELFANEQDRLREVAESDPGQRLRCASPGQEPLDQFWSAPAVPELATLIATDGSQIFPDHHGLAFYYLTNVGGIIYRQGSGRAPDVIAEPIVRYTEERLYPGGVPVSGDLVSVERDLAEMQVLASLASAEPAAGPPRLALGDGPLLIWLQRAAVPEGQQVQILNEYLSCLDQMRSEGVTLAGFVSRPRSAEVVALLYLAHLEEGERGRVTSMAQTEFRGLTDRVLFDRLEEGERSALFVRGTAANRDFRSRGHAAYFFYLRSGEEIARVEVPEWVASRPEELDLVHAAVYDQCRLNNGYPYVLTRADELAVILGEERELLETMIMRSMVDHGLSMPELSRKAQQKQVARWRRRR